MEVAVVLSLIQQTYSGFPFNQQQVSTYVLTLRTRVVAYVVYEDLLEVVSRLDNNNKKKNVQESDKERLRRQQFSRRWRRRCCYPFGSISCLLLSYRNKRVSSSIKIALYFNYQPWKVCVQSDFNPIVIFFNRTMRYAPLPDLVSIAQDSAKNIPSTIKP